MFTGKKQFSALLAFLLMALSVVVTYFITEKGNIAGFAIIMLIIALCVSLFFVGYPEFGFYFTIIYSFLITDIARYIGGGVNLSSTVDPLMIATFVGVLLSKIRKRERFWAYCDHPIVYVYIVYAVYTLMQIFNPNLETTTRMFLIIRKFSTLLLFLYATIQIFRTERQVFRFIWIFMGMAFLTALYGCYQQWVGMPQFELDFIQSDPLLVALYKLDDGGFRKSSFLANPKEYGLLMAACALIALILGLNLKINIKKRLLLFAGAVIFMIAMSYSGTRTATFMLVMGMVLYVIMTINKSSTLIFACVAILGFIFIMYAPIYGNVTINRVRSTFELNSDASLGVRDINRKRIQPYMHSHPFGGGLGTTGVLNMKEGARHPLTGFPTDSGFLQTALEVGWLGLLIQCFVYFTLIRQSIKLFYRSRKPLHKLVGLIAAITIFSYCVAQYAQVAIGAPPAIYLFYGMAAAVMCCSYLEKKPYALEYQAELEARGG